MTHFFQTDDGFICARKHAVSHPCLTSLPYQHSIEGWVSRNFPDAEYTASSRGAIHEIDLNAGGITAIQGAKGLGKSKAIAAGVRACPDATVLFITFSRALAWASLDILGEHGRLYSDISGCIVPSAHPRVCLVVNSIHRVEPGYDIVVIDEIVSVMTNVSGSLLSNQCRTAALTALVNIITAARCIVVADAMLDAACLRLILMCRGDRAPLPLRVFDYTHRVHKHYDYVPHAFLDTWESALDEGLRSGKNVAVACMTVPMVENLRARYNHVYRMISYTAADDPEILATHMREGVDSAWRRCQLLVYSPVITAGCSFEMRHFDLIFFYGKAGLASARSANQMISRIRDIAMKTVHVFISKGALGRGIFGFGYYAVSEAASFSSAPSLAEPATELDNGEAKHMRLLHQLWLFNEHERLQAAVAFPYAFWSFVVFSGAKITFPRANLWAEVPESLRARSRAQQMSGRASIADVDDAPVKPDTIVHCWDTDVNIKTPSIGVLSGQMLQRAGMWHIEHAQAMGVLEGVTLTVIPARVARLKHVEARGPRLRAWDLLVAQNAISRRRSPEETIAKIDCGSTRRSMFSYASVTGGGTKTVFASIAETYAATTATSLSLSPSSSPLPPAAAESCACVEAEGDLNDARLDELWLLAAVEATVRAKGPVVVPKLLLDPRPEDFGLARATAIEQAAYMAVFSGKDPAKYWVGVNVLLGTATVADVVLVEPVTRASHVYIFRASGRPSLAYDFDVLKGLALCTGVTPELKCVTVTLVYLKTFEAVEMDVSRWTSRQRVIRFLGTKGRLPYWNAFQSVVFVFFENNGTETEMTASVKFPNGDTRVHTTVENVFRNVSDFAVGSFTKLVSWGFRHVYDDKYARRVCDLEYTLADRMGHVFEPCQAAATTIRNARPLSEPCNDNDTMAGVDKLCVLYRSVIQKGALVYFKDAATPTSVDVYSLDSVAFLLQAQGGK